MPRGNSARRTMDGKIVVVIDRVQHTMSEEAFIELMQQAINVMQSLVASLPRSAPTSDVR